MQASELRVGNLIEFNNRITPKSIVTVNPRFFRSMMSDEDIEITPYYSGIPLTEKWLIKFGFNGIEWKFRKDFFFRINMRGQQFYMDIDEDIANWVLLKYVHQLQNIYFALTGEELLLKSSDSQPSDNT